MEIFSTNRLMKKSESAPNLNFKNYGGLRTQGWKKESQLNLPLISVVTIVRNNVSYLERTILSVLNQTYDNIEFIIIDGGSTDGTLDIIKRYENFIDIWISEPDQGSHDAINKGTNLIAGDWVIMLHSGDYFYNNEVVKDIFLKNKINADVVYGNFIGLIDEKEPALCVSFPDTKRLWQGMSFCHQTMFTRSWLAKKFKYDMRYKVSSDYDFVMKCYLVGAVFQKVDVIVTTIDTVGISNRYWLKARFENWEIAKRYKNDLETNIFHIRGIVYDVLFRAFKNSLSFLGVYGGLRDFYRKTLKEKIGIGVNHNIQKLK